MLKFRLVAPSGIGRDYSKFKLAISRLLQPMMCTCHVRVCVERRDIFVMRVYCFALQLKYAREVLVNSQLTTVLF